jgi:hypothetical protein
MTSQIVLAGVKGIPILVQTQVSPLGGFSNAVRDGTISGFALACLIHVLI